MHHNSRVEAALPALRALDTGLWIPDLGSDLRDAPPPATRYALLLDLSSSTAPCSLLIDESWPQARSQPTTTATGHMV